jgi:hypothetical protein
MEGKELLETGRIIFPLKERNLLLDIRNGVIPLKEIHELVEEKKNELEVFKGILPVTPDFHKINQLLMDMVESSWR